MRHYVVLPSRRLALWSSFLSLLLLATLLVACGDSSSAASTSGGSSTQAQTNSSSAASNTATITITEKTGGNDIYSFSPQTLTIKAGTAVKWVNNSDENHLLSSTPDGIFSNSSIVPRSGSNDNSYQTTFSKPGTYTITSKLVQREHNQPEGMDSSATTTITVTP